MPTALQSLLDQYRTASKTEREKGTYFELLIKDFLKKDPRYAPQFVDVLTYAEWAEKQGIDKTDDGIDLVAELADEKGYCAIQCKFYAEDHVIQKSNIDSFFTASGKSPFTDRIIIDSTRKDWSKHAENALNNQQIPVRRIGLNDLEESAIDWSTYAPNKTVKFKAKKSLRDYQQTALNNVKEGLSTADRGKLIMACGTGKTFTSLKIAEALAGKGKQVLFLVPSLSLMSQTITEWAMEAEEELRAFSVCSDSQVGKRKYSNDDLADLTVHDLAYPATTDARKLAEEVNKDNNENSMTVIFSTYQSIQTISDAQHLKDTPALPEFDLIICDEAHRTTGATLSDENESHFVKIHNQDFIQGKKRIYMTATPRIFSDTVKGAAKQADAVLCSMDDPDLFGEVLYQISFTEAVARKCLTDYKVLVLAVDETMVSASIQKRLADEDSELVLDDATKIIGCYRALSKLDVTDDVIADPNPMQRAVAFCKDIKSSKLIKDEFTNVVNDYIAHELKDETHALNCEVQHVDGTFNATARNARLSWLKEETEQDTCRILSNARCLSEGVDVPALDAILFLHPRKSQIDVVQSVGRVMRRAEGKNMGYVILPIGVPAGLSPEEALNDNKKYKIVWDVLNALRSHDERFDATINKMDLGVDVSSKIEVIAVTESLPEKAKTENKGSNIGHNPYDDEDAVRESSALYAANQTLLFDEFQKGIYARIVKKCGTRSYWADWANDIAKIAQTHITRITGILDDKHGEARKAFDEFLNEIRDDLNESITEADAIEMLAQHVITKPVFDALFEGYSFAQSNPVSQAMQSILAVLDTHNLEKESESLEKFYNSVKIRAAGIDNIEGKQKIIVELYDKFFRNAFPRMTDKLGIVYTPVEVVDFIIHSINDALQNEFGETLGSKNVHILDPFTGTGTFITRLLQSGLISKDELAYKYKNEIHANEIVLLAYYIAAINIEQVYHDLSGEYAPFEGICLTDTFQLYEKEDLVSNLLADNSSRREKQKKLDIRVIMGNPPYSAGQTSANDNNANVAYPKLDESIRSTYAEHSTATNKNALYDSYIRAIRWASDRLGNSGVMGFVSNASFIDSNTSDGLRKCLAEEFSSIYVFHLRGNARTSGEQRRKEKDNVFGQGTRTPIAISILIKKPDADTHGNIYLHDIGDYLNQEEKLAMISDFKSINGITQANGWQKITPDDHHDWVNQRDDSFGEFIKMGDKKDKTAVTLFENYSRGVATARDAWCYNASKKKLSANMQGMIVEYNKEREAYKILCEGLTKDTYPKPKDVIKIDPTKIGWSGDLIGCLPRNLVSTYDENNLVKSFYRPFIKSHLYYDSLFNERTYQMPRIFPDMTVENQVICVTGLGTPKDFTAIISNTLPDIQLQANGQCFPLKLYELAEETPEAENTQSDLFATQQNPTEGKYTVKDGLTDAGLAHFQQAYSDETINKEDVFYYIYGLLHSEDYKTRYADNLTKELPRIPCVKQARDFWAYSQAGRELAELHINYETVKPYDVAFEGGELFMDDYTAADYRVEKMKFAKTGKVIDKTTVIYNNKITLTNIPLEAYDYIVNGKPALEWVMERQAVTTDKKSGITNDANDWAIETMGNAKYPLELFQRVITVSLKTMKIVKALPRLDID